jgi:phenylpropionate dioxygenase-like ring-hydroxylating dioxygenase large terminal subunit
MTNTPELLTNTWYMALPGKLLKPGQMKPKKLLNRRIVLGRDKTGEVFALRDICPHRGIPLSYGTFDGCEIQCCYHGWRFDTQGTCTDIPSLVPEQKINLSRIKVGQFPCKEVQGNIWIYIPANEKDSLENIPSPPLVPDFDAQKMPVIAESCLFPCDIDHAVVGLMDPAHGPFVHQSWWWRSPKSAHVKSKQFAPIPLGFKMVKHPPSKNSKAYRLLGGERSTEISFQLPGVRIEHIQAGRYTICALTTLTPIDASNTEIHQFFYWQLPAWATILQPIFKRFARAFLHQDLDVIVKQQEGLEEDPQLMLINDADTQAKWYYQLKREYLAAQTEGRPFEHPISETSLKWRS